MSTPEVNRPFPVMRVVVQCVAVIAIIAGGFFAMKKLQSFLKEPPKRPSREIEREVGVASVEPEDVPVTITGHGTVRAKNTVQVIPQVSGRVVEVSPQFKTGHRIAAKELLFRLEDDDYRNARDRATADKLRLTEQIKMQDTMLAFDRRKLGMAKRSRALAEVEFKRVSRLYKEDKIGTLSVVEAAERTFLARENDVIALESSIELHPIRVAELNAQLASVEAQYNQAVLDVGRTKVRAPFDARVDSANVQVGQVLMAGGAMSPAGVLSDLRVFEVPVSIDNADLSWLPTKAITEQGEYDFRDDAKVTIRWAQGASTSTWPGRISRLEAFDSENRTISLVVEAVAPVATSPDRLRLEEGMFCEVSIGGRTAAGVYRIPRGLVSAKGLVQVMHEGRLAMRKVEVERYDGDHALVREGFAPGERIVTTPIAKPVAGTKLKVRRPSSKPEDDKTPPADAERDRGEGGDARSAPGEAGNVGDGKVENASTTNGRRGRP